MAAGEDLEGGIGANPKAPVAPVAAAAAPSAPLAAVPAAAAPISSSPVAARPSAAPQGCDGDGLYVARHGTWSIRGLNRKDVFALALTNGMM